MYTEYNNTNILLRRLTVVTIERLFCSASPTYTALQHGGVYLVTIDAESSDVAGPYLHRVSKNCAKLFLSELRQLFTNFDNFWQKDSKDAKILRGALIFHLI